MYQIVSKLNSSSCCDVCIFWELHYFCPVQIWELSIKLLGQMFAYTAHNSRLVNCVSVHISESVESSPKEDQIFSICMYLNPPTPKICAAQNSVAVFLPSSDNGSEPNLSGTADVWVVHEIDVLRSVRGGRRSRLHQAPRTEEPGVWSGCRAGLQRRRGSLARRSWKERDGVSVAIDRVEQFLPFRPHTPRWLIYTWLKEMKSKRISMVWAEECEAEAFNHNKHKPDLVNKGSKNTISDIDHVKIKAEYKRMLSNVRFPQNI